MNAVFSLSAVVAVVSTVMVITSANAVRALLYLIVSLLAIALVFFVLGAPLAAALEVVVYAGAIVVLFLFVVMLLNLGDKATAQELGWLSPRAWIGPAILTGALMGELVYALLRIGAGERGDVPVGPAQVGQTLFGAYVLGVELASMLLLAGLVGAYHLGRRVQGSGFRTSERRRAEVPNPEPRTPKLTRSPPMASVPIEHGLLLAAVLFALGLIGVLVRRNVVFILLSIEIMLNAAGLAFVVAGSRWQRADGQVMFFFVLTMAAAEVSVGLALVLQFYERFKTLDADEASTMRG